MIVVTGSVTAREDSLDEVRRLSLEHVHRSRKEPGCISHAVHVDCENSLRLVFIEQWADRAALSAHFAVPASRSFVRARSRSPRHPRRSRFTTPPGWKILNQSMHSWIATPISYCNAT